ncbi:hypothetical protein HMPREF9696_00394 [Afipia clevelandensis ATCC 49720]|uniref:Uncharacterized protein n=1 Tax=Afipia clevelandensis ATCC 49720 TaxID=883079 RepID=K8PMM8_9BRAD|nr:hypothetical protein HMPREF9696_00394 [Afipia clevelandensis ATCC 49720]
MRLTKNPAFARPGFVFPPKRPDQVRVRDRIWKLSKLYSATCHQVY